MHGPTPTSLWSPPPFWEMVLRHNRRVAAPVLYGTEDIPSYTVYLFWAFVCRRQWIKDCPHISISGVDLPERMPRSPTEHPGHHLRTPRRRWLLRAACRAVLQITPRRLDRMLRTSANMHPAVFCRALSSVPVRGRPQVDVNSTGHSTPVI